MNKEKNIFMFWDTGISNASLLCQLNVLNFKTKLKKTDWNFYVLSLNKNDQNYIENFIKLPKYFFLLKDKITDIHGIKGNQSDIIRLRLLEKYGGGYFDASTFLLKDKIEQIFLYKLFNKKVCEIAGYSNFTFTRKLEDGRNYFPMAQDGIELGAIFAKKKSSVLQELNYEIDKYWEWKLKNKNYKSYAPFKQYNLQPVSFLNEYHIHYSLFHLILTRNKKLSKKIQTQSIHMIGKENSLKNGPYSLTDKFCRGKNGYGEADPKKMVEVFSSTQIESYYKRYSIVDRVNFINSLDMIIIPNYLRVGLEKEFDTKEKIFNNALFKKIYRTIVDIVV